MSPLASQRASNSLLTSYLYTIGYERISRVEITVHGTVSNLVQVSTLTSLLPLMTDSDLEVEAK